MLQTTKTLMVSHPATAAVVSVCQRSDKQRGSKPVSGTLHTRLALLGKQTQTPVSETETFKR